MLIEDATLQQIRGQVIDILLVEDNPGDIELTQQALSHSEMGVSNRLFVVTDGEKALKFLRRQGEYAEAVKPDIILLDLNLPKIGGIDVLKIIKAEPRLRAIPVVVLTSSAAERDIVDAYSLHANCYLTKPIELIDFTRMILAIKNFWLSSARLPIDFKRVESPGVSG